MPDKNVETKRVNNFDVIWYVWYYNLELNML